MLRLSRIGMIALGSSLLLLLYQSIETLTKRDSVWAQLKVGDMIAPRYFDWAIDVEWAAVDRIAAYFINMPLFLLLFGIGVIFLLISGFTER